MAISRTELLGILKELGCDITERQLRYFEEKKLIDRPAKNGKEVYYPASVINDILVIYKLKQVDSILKIYKDQLIEILVPKGAIKYVERLCKEIEVQNHT